MNSGFGKISSLDIIVISFLFVKIAKNLPSIFDPIQRTNPDGNIVNNFTVDGYFKDDKIFFP